MYIFKTFHDTSAVYELHSDPRAGTFENKTYNSKKGRVENYKHCSLVLVHNFAGLGVDAIFRDSS